MRKYVQASNVVKPIHFTSRPAAQFSTRLPPTALVANMSTNPQVQKEIQAAQEGAARTLGRDLAPDELNAINERTMGVNFPSITLPTGEKVQTGTVGALLANMKAFDTIDAKYQKGEKMSAEDEAQLNTIKTSIRGAIPTLKRLGMFNLFAPEEWIRGSKSAGRTYVGECGEEMSDVQTHTQF